MADKYNPPKLDQVKFIHTRIFMEVSGICLLIEILTYTIYPYNWKKVCWNKSVFNQTSASDSIVGNFLLKSQKEAIYFLIIVMSSSKVVFTLELPKSQ